MFKRFIGIMLMASLFVACGKKTRFVTPADRTPASRKAEDNFKITKPIQSGLNKAQIAIKRQSLGKEFLLSAQLINLPGVPQFNGSKSRIVMFLEEHGSVFMLESSKGNVINDEIPASFVIAEFPVIQSTDEYVIFDFNKGTEQLFTASDWRASDFDGSKRDGVKEFQSVDVSVSYIKSAYFSVSQKLVIRQAALISTREGTNKNTNVEALYYFTPYIPREDFTPTRTTDFTRMGFFEIAPLLTDVETDIFATKFGDGQITYAMSANTPELYRDAVREGILYWNKAFGYEKLKAIVAPEGVNAPHPDYNVVQWVNWDTAGMAYADAQMDPRTGEILHAQVFQTSVFAIANKNRARRYLRALKDKKNHEHSHRVGLGGLSSKGLCDLDHNAIAEQFAHRIITMDADEETVLRMSQDMVREVVAHEVGHTLGLRHNFAGNLAANYDATEVDAKFQNYAEGKLDPELVPTSSVMDYLRMESAMPSGALIKSGEKAFAYDEAAIQTLYAGKQYKINELPLYCTDTHRDKYLGCAIWDHGHSPIYDLKRKRDMALDNWSSDLVEKFIKLLTGPEAVKKTPKELVLNAEGDVGLALKYREKLLSLAGAEASDLRVRRSHHKVDSTNIEEIRDEEVRLWVKELGQLGGLSELLVRPGSSLVAELEAKSLRLLNSPQYQSGIGYDGKPYTLSSKTTKEIEQALTSYFDAVEENLPLSDIGSLTQEKLNLRDNVIANELSEILYQRSLRYLMAEDGEKIEGDIRVGDEKAIRVSVPKYKYSHDIRTKALKLLFEQKSMAIDWAYDYKRDVKSTFNEELKSILNDKEIKEVKVEESKGELRRWLLQNLELWGISEKL